MTRRTTDDLRTASLLVGVTRVVLLVVGVAATWMIADGPGPDVGPLAIWRRWDADLYLKIAEHGYAGSDPYSEAFPPGFPLAIRALTLLGIGPVVAGMGLALVGTVVATTELIRLADADEGPDTGWRAALVLLTFPTAVFLVAPYTEPLFLAGAIGAFRAAREGRWWRAGVFAAVGTAVRVAGVFLLLGLVVEAIRRRDRAGPVLGGLAVGAAPLVAYGAWLWSVRGDPFYVLTAQRAGWSRAFTAPWHAFQRTLDAATGGTGNPNFTVTFQAELVAATIGVVLVGVLVARREWGYATYVGTMFAALLTSTWYLSVPRILLTAFPLPILIAAWSRGSPQRLPLVVAVSAPLAALGTVVFTRGAWFF